ncbi:MAG TPA: heavy metal-binding domain-containing protein [Bacteroidales bacterium]|nr:heavy metal-binding domain-containing protein [Bacteroidales bacterium]
MKTQVDNCFNCLSPIKSNILSSNRLVTERATVAINKILGKAQHGYCEKCISPLATQVRDVFAENDRFLNQHIGHIPILTTHNPYQWAYMPVSIVTGQIVIGTGVISEFKSSLTDFFGEASNSFAEKIAMGEKNIFAQLRKKVLQMDCDAVIATDIDYAELGSLKNMIMVCASGTAVKIKNVDILGENAIIITKLKESFKMVLLINEYKDSLVSY